jgi:hypothetical protein
VRVTVDGRTTSADGTVALPRASRRNPPHSLGRIQARSSLEGPAKGRISYMLCSLPTPRETCICYHLRHLECFTAAP